MQIKPFVWLQYKHTQLLNWNNFFFCFAHNPKFRENGLMMIEWRNRNRPSCAWTRGWIDVSRHFNQSRWYLFMASTRPFKYLMNKKWTNWTIQTLSDLRHWLYLRICVRANIYVRIRKMQIMCPCVWRVCVPSDDKWICLFVWHVNGIGFPSSVQQFCEKGRSV